MLVFFVHKAFFVRIRQCAAHVCTRSALIHKSVDRERKRQEERHAARLQEQPQQQQQQQQQQDEQAADIGAG